MPLQLPKLSVPVCLFCLFAFVVSVRLLLLTLSSSYPVASTLDPRNENSGLDSGEYIRYAKNTVFHGTYSHSENAPFHPSAFRTPVYPLFLAPFFRLASSDTQALLWITMAQIGLAGVSSLLLHAIALRVTGNKVFSWAAAAIASLDLYSIRLNYMVTAEPLFIALLLATTLVFLRYLERSHLIHLAGSMILLVCTGLCRPVALYFLPVFLLFVVWRQARNTVNAQRSTLNAQRSTFKPLLVAILVFTLALTPWVLRNWSTMNYFTVYTNGSYMNAFLADGLLTVKRTGDPIPKMKLNWKELDQMVADSLEDLNAAVGTKVSYDANMRHLLGLDHPQFTKQFESILQSKADRILRENRMAHLKSSLATFLLMPFWTPDELLCRILGDKGTTGLSDIMRSARNKGWSETFHLISELRCCKLVGYVWTHGYLVCLHGFGLIGLGSILVSAWSRGRRVHLAFDPAQKNDTPHPTSPSRGEETQSSQHGVLASFPLPLRERTKVRGIRDAGEARMRWMFLAAIPFLLMAAPSWGTAIGWEMARFRAPAIPFITIFAVVGFALLLEKFRRRKTKHTKT